MGSVLNFVDSVFSPGYPVAYAFLAADISMAGQSLLPGIGTNFFVPALFGGYESGAENAAFRFLRPTLEMNHATCAPKPGLPSPEMPSSFTKAW